MALAPTNIQQIGNELAIQWSDGGESYLNLELLRRACPCAACGGEPDVLGNVLRPEVSHTDASFQLDSFVVVGGYALQPRWHDGHNTGIYSFQYLRRLASSTTPHKESAANSVFRVEGRALSRRNISRTWDMRRMALSHIGIVMRRSDVPSPRGWIIRSCNEAGTRKKSPGVKSTPAHRSAPVKHKTMANCPSGAIAR